MAVAKSVFTAVALILLQSSCCSDADICDTNTSRLTKDHKFCPQDRMTTTVEGNYTYLPCDEFECETLPQECELSEEHDVSSSSISFTTQMCLTNDLPSPRQVGFMFNWTLLAGQEEVTRLKICVYSEHDTPQIWILLSVNLTGQVDSGNTKYFSTDCLASEDVEVGREYFVSVQVLPSEERFHVPGSFTFIHDCVRPRLSEIALCPAAPWKRPISKGFCNGTVEVTVNSGFPPGITTETEFKIVVKLCLKIDRSNCLSKTKTVEVALAESEESKVTFENVNPGVYYAMMAFEDKHGIPCDGHFYKQSGNFSVVNHPPKIDLDSKSVCNQPVEVTVTADSFEGTLDHEFSIRVILSGSGAYEGQDLTRTSVVTKNPNTSFVINKVYFNSVPPGNYTISTEFEDEYYTNCNSDVTRELTVTDCHPTSHTPAIIPTTHTPAIIPGDKFWDLYGKFILGVGILSIFISVIAYLLHERWLKLNRRIAEQQRSLPENRGSSADGLSSIADTTVQESHLHRFLNDTGQGWTSQVDFTTTGVQYNHQPMSADSGEASDEYETQSWQENESIAFSV